MLDNRPELNQIQDISTRDLFQSILDGAVNDPIILESAPTTSGGEVPEGKLAFYGGNLYWTINKTTYKFTGASV